MTRVQRLDAYPRSQLIAEHLVRGRAHELDLLNRFGEPTQATPPLESDDPVFYWDLAFGCGMIMAIDFHQITEQIGVRLDAPEIDHALRHLGVEVRDLELLAEVQPDRYAEEVAGLPPLHLWADVWQVRPDGERVCVASGLSERDAWCRVAELEEAAEPGTFEVLVPAP